MPLRKRQIALMFLLAWVCSTPLFGDETPPIYKSKYRVINVHYHGAPPTEASFQAMLNVMDRVGIAMIVSLDGDSPRGSLPAWLELQTKYPDRLTVFAKVDLQDAKQPTFFSDLVARLERQAVAGIKGVKVWKDLGLWI